MNYQNKEELSLLLKSADKRYKELKKEGIKYEGSYWDYLADSVFVNNFYRLPFQLGTIVYVVLDNPDHKENEAPYVVAETQFDFRDVMFVGDRVFATPDQCLERVKDLMALEEANRKMIDVSEVEAVAEKAETDEDVPEVFVTDTKIEECEGEAVVIDTDESVTTSATSEV